MRHKKETKTVPQQSISVRSRLFIRGWLSFNKRLDHQMKMYGLRYNNLKLYDCD